MAIVQISSSKCCGGEQKTFSHFSTETKCLMKFSMFMPPQMEKERVPVLWHLNGFKTNEDFFLRHNSPQQYAVKHGICIVSPDTSPRNVLKELDNYDLGEGASFYVDATQIPWNEHYRMYSYVTSELRNLIIKNFNVLPDKQSISGYSMGGHGALISALRNPSYYVSVSTYAGVANSIKSKRSIIAFKAYLGNDEKKWKIYDATELVKTYDGPHLTIFLDQGTIDSLYLTKRLLPENFIAAAKKNKNIKVLPHFREGYSHSQEYYVSTFVEEHFDFHAQFLRPPIQIEMSSKTEITE